MATLYFCRKYKMDEKKISEKNLGTVKMLCYYCHTHLHFEVVKATSNTHILIQNFGRTNRAFLRFYATNFANVNVALLKRHGSCALGPDL